MELDELMEGIDFGTDDFSANEEDDDNTVELKITAKRKEKKPASLEQLFNELIDEYNMNAREDLHISFLESIDPFNCAAEKKDVTESLCKVKLAVNDYLNVTDETGERFILLPDRDGTRFVIGSDYHIFTEQYKGYSFLVCDCTTGDYTRYMPAFDGMNTDERCAAIKQAKADPEGFELWGKLGNIKRPEGALSTPRKAIIQRRTEEFLKRIPLKRNDLYNSLDTAYNRFIHSSSSENADREEALLTKMKVISMMLTARHPAEPLTADRLIEKLGEAKVSTHTEAKERGKDWLPNILIVGSGYNDAVNRICDSTSSLVEIPLGGVEGNDYLFGDEMSYYCSGHGQLVASITEKTEYPSIVLFSDIDLMGTTVRSSNPLYGLVALLRRHTFRDFYLRDLSIDVSQIQFICQVNRIEDCPDLLLREMDIVVEL